MQTRPRPAIVTLRMSRSLRDALHSAAAAETTDEPHVLVRDERGFPLQLAARGRHIVARSAFFEAMAADTDAVTADRLVRQHELEDPAFFVEWYRSREA
jgi:hypothetical protein